MCVLYINKYYHHVSQRLKKGRSKRFLSSLGEMKQKIDCLDSACSMEAAFLEQEQSRKNKPTVNPD